jgi:hypothetical protein
MEEQKQARIAVGLLGADSGGQKGDRTFGRDEIAWAGVAIRE